VAISAGDVKALRDQTGAGMMECKRALADADGDVERAIELLRERGLSKAGKRAGRATSEGVIAVAVAGARAGIVELGCETDFVAKTDAFLALAQSVAEVVAANPSLAGPEAVGGAKLGGSTVAQTIQETIAKVGENIELKRAQSVDVGKGVTGAYVHMGGKLGVVVGLTTPANSGSVAELAKDVAMHVAAADPSPIAIDRDGVDAETVEKERRILTAQAKESGKPDNVIEKMVSGRINKFFAEHCLLEQAFVKDPDTTVGKLVAKAAKDLGSDIAVASFVRFRIGEGGEASQA